MLEEKKVLLELSDEELKNVEGGQTGGGGGGGGGGAGGSIFNNNFQALVVQFLGAILGGGD